MSYRFNTPKEKERKNICICLRVGQSDFVPPDTIIVLFDAVDSCTDYYITTGASMLLDSCTDDWTRVGVSHMNIKYLASVSTTIKEPTMLSHS